MILKLIVKTGSDAKPAAAPVAQLDTAAVWDVLKKGWADMNEPGLDASARQSRASWIGGAIRIFSAFTKESPEAIQGRLRGEISPPAAAPSSSAPDDLGAFATFTPPEERTNRPKVGPGAPRPVEPSLDTASQSGAD